MQPNIGGNGSPQNTEVAKRVAGGGQTQGGGVLGRCGDADGGGDSGGCGDTDGGGDSGSEGHPRSRLGTIAQAAETYPFSEAALRDIKFKAFDRCNSRGELIKGNGSGLAGCWIQVGNKVLLDFDAFELWLLSHRLTGDAK